MCLARSANHPWLEEPGLLCCSVPNLGVCRSDVNDRNAGFEFRHNEIPQEGHGSRISRVIAGREVVLSYLSAGNYVGEMALLSESPRMATVKAAVTTEAIVLDSATFQRVLARNPKWRQEMEELFLDRLRANAAMEARPDPGNIIAFLMQQGVGEATDVLLIDESLCVRCNNCEKACADVHDGNSRLNREAGPTFAQIHVPTSCRHCEHPHCMKDCPPDAIHRSAEGEVFITRGGVSGSGSLLRHYTGGRSERPRPLGHDALELELARAHDVQHQRPAVDCVDDAADNGS